MRRLISLRFAALFGVLLAISPAIAAPPVYGPVMIQNYGADIDNPALFWTNIGGGSAGKMNVGTSGAAIPQLSGANTWGGLQNLNGGVNTTASTGYQVNGLTGLVVTGGAAGLPYQQLVAIGPGACQALRTANTTIANGLFCAGVDSGRFATNGGAENYLSGQYTGYNITTAQFVTAVGDGVVSFDNSNYMAGFAGDTFRDTIGCTGCDAFGPLNQRDGIGNHNGSKGLGALQGNAGSLTFLTNPTIGDTWTIHFTTSSSGTLGLPATASFTAATTSLSDLTAGLATSIISTLQATVTGSLPDSTPANTDAQFGLSAFGTGNVLSLHFPGSQSQGWAITPTATCAGVCTSTATVADAFSGVSNRADGVDALYGAALTTGSYNHARGDGALVVLAGTSSGVQCDGYHCGYVALSGTSSVIAGLNAMDLASVLNYDVVIGGWNSVTTGIEETLIGEPNGGTLPTTATGDTLVGYGCRVKSATASWSGCVGNAMYWINANIGGGGSNYGTVGFGGQMAPVAVVDILGPDTTAATLAFRALNSGLTQLIAAYDGGDVVAGSGMQLSALNVTSGFWHFPFTNATSGSGGIPTGTPGNIYGNSCVWNDVTFVLDCYSASAGAWKHIAFSSGAG